MRSSRAMQRASLLLTIASSLIVGTVAQTFQRLGTCPDLGCVFPPDQADFLPGQTFDIRVEVHAPVNGSEAYASGILDENFYLEIQMVGGDAQRVDLFFNLPEPRAYWLVYS